MRLNRLFWQALVSRNNVRVHILFWTKNSRTLTFFISHFFKDFIQWKKEPWAYLCLALSHQENYFYPEVLCVCSFSFAVLPKLLVSIEIQGLSSADCNFQGLSRIFKVHTKPCSVKMWWHLISLIKTVSGKTH